MLKSDPLKWTSDPLNHFFNGINIQRFTGKQAFVHPSLTTSGLAHLNHFVGPFQVKGVSGSRFISVVFCI